MRLRLGLLLMTAALSVAAQPYELLIQGGRVIDPGNDIDAVLDVAVQDGKIARVAAGIDPDDARKVVDASGAIVTPGLIDLHAHVFGYSGSIFPDDTALFAGTTTVVDCGGAGWRTFEELRETVIETAKTRVLSFINIVGRGMIGSPYESDVSDMEPEKTAAKMAEHPDLIVGIKTAHFAGAGWAAIDNAIKAGELSGKPVIIDDKIFTNTGRHSREKLLEKMRPGDMHTHAFNDRQVEIVDRFSGKVQPYVWEARKRGVLFDLGHGGGSFCGQWLRLTNLTIPSSVTSIGDYAFSGCFGLTSLAIPSGVTSIGRNAFSGCGGLISITIPSRVTSIGEYAFSGCSGLTSITIPPGVTSIRGFTFSNCDGLTSITIPSSVKTIGREAFSGCDGLINITIPFGVTTIGQEAFTGCQGLSSVTIPLSVTSIGYRCFTGCSELTSITIPSSVTSIGPGAFQFCSKLSSATILTGVTSIERSTFYGCTNLTAVTIPPSVKSIGSYAFYRCPGLTSIAIPSSVTSIGDYAFFGCSGLTSVTIPPRVTSIGNYAFSDCTGLTSVTIPPSVTSIGSAAFNNCTGLRAVRFLGNAPGSFFRSAFTNTAAGFTVFYRSGSTGFTSPTWEGYTAVELEPGVVTQEPITSVADIDLEGDFLYAINVGGPAQTVGGVPFVSDQQDIPGVSWMAQNVFEEWLTKTDLGVGADNEALATVLWSIRWSRVAEEPGGVSYELRNLDPGKRYKLQLLFAEKCCERGFDVTVNGKMIYDDFSPDLVQSQAGGHASAGAALIYTFTSGSNTLAIDLDGMNADFPDRNAMLSGITLEQLPPVETFPIVSAADLDLQGDFLYAINVGGSAQTVGGVQFFSDQQAIPGVDWMAQNVFEEWLAKTDLGAGADNEALATVLWSIRWSRVAEEPGGVSYELRNLDPGKEYKLQLLFAEKCCERGFDVTVNGEMIYEDFSPDLVQSQAGGHAFAGAALVYTFTSSSGILTINLDGMNADFPDRNAILSGITLERIAGAPQTLGIIKSPAGVALQVPDGETYDIEYSADLVNWTVIASGVTGIYMDAGAGENMGTAGYYRGVVK